MELTIAWLAQGKVRTPAGREDVLAKAVLAYDLAPNGSVIFSNGNAISVRHPDRRIERRVVESMIEQVVVV
jgi:hypothetical protein